MVVRVVDVDDADDLPHRRLDVVVLVPVVRDRVLPVKVVRCRVDKVPVLDPERDRVVVLARREVPRVVVPGNRLAVDDDANRVGDETSTVAPESGGVLIGLHSFVISRTGYALLEAPEFAA